jgi:ARG/rhodanese/phosphatase superfamily protein
MTLIPGSRTLAAALCVCALILAALALPAGQGTAGAKGRQNDFQWRVGTPISYKNLSIFPVLAADLPGSDAYITLDEGTKRGTVIITERGGGQSAQRSSHAQRQNVAYSGGASVNELALVNRSGKKLLLLAGEVVVGGKQDRIVQEDRLIPPVSIPVALSVFCVEHGRWTPRTAGYNSGGGAQRSAAAPMEAPDDTKFSSLGALAHPKLRGVAQDKKVQSEVWKEVGENNAKLGTSNSTDTYQEVYTSGRVGAQMDDYVRALEREVVRPGVVGVVVARNGKVVWVDVFASQRLFASYWPKLLKSYVVDALGDNTSDARPSVAEASRYLNERQGTLSAMTQEGVYQLLKTEQKSYAIFDLRDISLTSPLRVHWNKMDR